MHFCLEENMSVKYHEEDNSGIEMCRHDIYAYTTTVRSQTRKLWWHKFDKIALNNSRVGSKQAEDLRSNHFHTSTRLHRAAWYRGQVWISQMFDIVLGKHTNTYSHIHAHEMHRALSHHQARIYSWLLAHVMQTHTFIRTPTRTHICKQRTERELTI